MNPHTTFREARTNHLADTLRVLAEPNRLKIFNLLMQGIHCNCELSGALDMAPNLISHHLRILREADLITMERDEQDARWVYYSVNLQELDAINTDLAAFLDPDRIQPRSPHCGPHTIS